MPLKLTILFIHKFGDLPIIYIISDPLIIMSINLENMFDPTSSLFLYNFGNEQNKILFCDSLEEGENTYIWFDNVDLNEAGSFLFSLSYQEYFISDTVE